VRKAAASVLSIAEELGLESVAFPPLGTGAGKVSPEDAAAAIVEAIKAHKAKSVSDITLISGDAEPVEAFVKVLERFEEESA
jgi:O-acetyl-ADP-ribose deacetylase (regulator of RNase III)